MDLPDVFNDWSWSRQSISSLDNIIAYHLEEPYQPSWDKIREEYPLCVGGEVIFWLCDIEDESWVFFQASDSQWVLLEKGEYIGPDKIDVPNIKITQSLVSDIETRVYLFPGDVDFINSTLIHLNNQNIESFESVNIRNDVWNLKNDLGRVTITGNGRNVIIVHTTPVEEK